MTRYACALLTTSEMAEADRRTIAAGTPGIELMERAGQAVAENLMERVRIGDGPVAVFCGPGNNGGDGFIAARVLHAAGYEVALGLLGARESLQGDAAEAARRWGRRPLPVTHVALEGAAAVVDALFGAGLARDLDGEARAIVERINAWRAAGGGCTLAVDVPSGLDGNTGRIRGVAIEADATTTFFRRKPGHLLLPGRVLCGDIEVEDIGIPDTVLDAIAPRTFANETALWRAAYPVPREAGHKYSRGHAVVVSGDAWHSGAARLAARATLRAGAGLVTLACPQDAGPIHAAHLTAVMLARAGTPDELANLLVDGRKNAVVMGPGLGVGEATRGLVSAALSAAAAPEGRGFVLDADALTSFAGEAVALRDLVRAAPGPVVLTPHEGEFARLFRDVEELAEALPKDELAKQERARRAAAWLGATIVLKGADSIVAHPDGRASIGCLSAPWLATAGSGDVLAGIVGGLLAQGMPGFEAASAAVWLHARAAQLFGPGLISEDLPELLPKAVGELVA